LCQDTGMVVVFLDIGQDVHLTGGDLETAINEGVRQGYRDGHLRASTLDPLTRKNLGDNTPAVIHTSIVPGDRIKVALAAKGFGSENMSQVALFPRLTALRGSRNSWWDELMPPAPIRARRWWSGSVSGGRWKRRPFSPRNLSSDRSAIAIRTLGSPD
jgi:fumarate hydratase subunit alpha